MCSACGGASPASNTAPATVADAGTSVQQSDVASKVEEEHKAFVANCTSAAASSSDYCECAWNETRAVFSDEELATDAADPDKLERVRSKVGTMCASKLPEDAVKKGFAAGCAGDKPEMQAYCDCSWNEYRKKFAAQDLARPDIVSNASFAAARAGVVKACASKMPENVVHESFMNGCANDPKANEFCECAWKELRKTSNAAEIEAGLFDRQAFITKTEKVCGKLKPTN